MNSRERVNLILQHKEADHVPAYPLVNSISSKYIGIGYDEWSIDPEKCAEAIIAATDALDLDLICTLVDLSVEAEGWGMKVKYHPNKAAVPDDSVKLITCPEDYDKIQVIDPTKALRMGNMIKTTKILADKKKADKHIVAFVFGPMGTLSMMAGMEVLLVDCIKKDRKEKVQAAIERIGETLIAYCDALIDAGADAIILDTLFASRTIMRASMWDKFEGPTIQKMAEHIHSRGAAVLIHNCGEGIYFKEQIERIHPEAINMLHLPPDCATKAELKEKYGSVTTLIGQIDPGFLMAADEDQVREQCRELIDAYKKDGGFILSTGCEYPEPLDDTFAKIMMEEARTYGKY
ncbi:uroporphyrinogen decarboxylase family protein [Bengtsoniella intestinalis]|uniref:uroporphyrinogen decarboxylase family protein n=1 Tax=Bengtsoniella intestinalis TaxID=3073143 RepID=UPI00391EFBD1